MPEEPAASNSADPRLASFYIGNMPDPSQPTPIGPAGTFGFWLNGKMYDPNRVDMKRQLGATEDWTLASCGEPHIFHIDVNPFETMDVTHRGRSIFGQDGECAKHVDDDGLQGRYCNRLHIMKDTIFGQNDYQVHVRTTCDRYIGEFVIYCHILDHEDGGMMFNILVQPDVTAPNGGLGMAGMRATSNGTMTMPISDQ